MGEVLAARPFIVRKQHRAVLDADSNLMILRESHQRRPDLPEPRPVVLDGFRPVPPDEGRHLADAQKRRRGDDLLEMARREARDILDADPRLESDSNRPLRQSLLQGKKSDFEWSVIS